MEYDTVFISGMEEGSMPSCRSRGDVKIKQEKLLVHLASLCARTRLYYTALLAGAGAYSPFLEPVYHLLAIE